MPGDSGDLVVAAFTHGIPHPPGYPLYTFIAGILTRLPLFTPAWRVALLSSISNALVVGLIGFLIYKLTRSILPAIIVSILLIANYVFFLYSIVPEVFGLNDLFIVSITVALYLWATNKNRNFFYISVLLFGLALSHHQIILFLVPAIIFYIDSNRKFIKYPASTWYKSIGLILVGLLPYIYVPLTALKLPIIDWEYETTFANFIRLVSRSR